MTVRRRELLGPETVARPVPVNLRPEESGLFFHEHRRQIGTCSVLEVEQADVLPNGFVLSQKRLLREALVTSPRGVRLVKAWARILQHRTLSRARVVPRGLWASDEFSNGYFHWVCDVLPRLEALGATGPEGRTLLVPAMANDTYVPESLAAYELSDIQIVSWTERVSCKDLLVVEPTAPTGNYRPALMDALRSRMRRFFGAGLAGRRIYVSRAGAAVRRIANEEEILPLFRRYGFETIKAEQLSFPEQVRLMGSASILAGNHGAGLTHICWMLPGTSVLELRRRGDAANNCYYALAGALGVRYYYLSCDAAREQDPTHRADLVVDPVQLEHELVRLGSR